MGKLDSVEKIVEIGRVSKTVRGGRTPSYFAFAVVGYKNGTVGCGRGKASDVQGARAKAVAKAIKSLVFVSLSETGEIQHNVSGSSKCSHVFIRKCSAGTGIIANNKLRAIFECAGIRNVNVKVRGTSNTGSMIVACLNALQKLGHRNLC